MKFWWVNQNQTYKQEVKGGFLWSPKTKSDGARNRFYENMTRVSSGDLVFSFSDTLIKAVGKAQGPAQSATKPDFGSIGAQWDDEGWLVPVEFEEASAPFKPKEIISELKPLMPEKYAPLKPNGDGYQHVYLAEVSEAFATKLLDKLGPQFSGAFTQIAPDDSEQKDDEEERGIKGRTDISETQKEQLISARRGQGKFRANVRLNEAYCRITGLAEARFLIASHIKPWRFSNDEEKLDGCNGLLLSPHADKLFDKGFISLSDDGSVLISDQLSPTVWESWFPAALVAPVPLNQRQKAYMAYHRAEVFK